MPGEEKPGARDAQQADSTRRVKAGPRHAAPKKSVLNRLQMPAGKAIALAAMPTAVLMGMGLTPQLANADPRGDFKAGPCVSQPDEAGQTDEADKAKDQTGEDQSDQTAEDQADKGGQTDEPKAEPSPGPSSSPSGGASKPEPEPKPSEPAEDKPEPAPEESSATPSPAPSEEESTNPLDPLGLGDKVVDLFDGDSGEQTQAPAEPSTAPSPTATPKADAEPEPTKPAADADDAVDAVDAVDKAADGAKDTAGKAQDTVEDAKDTARDTADKATPTPTPSSSGSSSSTDGEQGYPCPEYDAEAYNNAKTERAEALLPEDPWVLRSSKLSLHGLKYDGIVEVKTYSGKIKKVLKFRASGVDIKDLHQLVVGPAGTTQNVEARKGSTSTISDGEVTMYTEELSGNLLGLIPVTFSPKAPPPLTLPELFFTDVKVIQAGQFGGTLTIPGMHAYKTGG